MPLYTGIAANWNLENELPQTRAHIAPFSQALIQAQRLKPTKTPATTTNI
jgi:hypothetical protein